MLDDNALDGDLAGVLIDFDFDDHGGISVVAFVGDAGDAAAGGDAGLA